jgi:hypothetical protein
MNFFVRRVGRSGLLARVLRALRRGSIGDGDYATTTSLLYLLRLSFGLRGFVSFLDCCINFNCYSIRVCIIEKFGIYFAFL